MTKYAQINEVGRQGLGALDDSEFATLAKDNPHQVFLLSVFGRPGFGEFLQELEYKLYTPDTNANHRFEMILVQWEGLMYTVAAFPKEDLEEARKLATEFELQLDRGTMVCMTSEHPEPLAFPMEENENVFVAKGACQRLANLPEEERRRLFCVREEQLKKEYNVTG